ncbi:TIM23 complex component [Exophiala dermatitidis]|uniref:Presequence translocated-associated motor subunit PAM17 n=2 Tax=Exophiala dermatitidis TaxID=5970 RepID=H6BMU2_EXODN|nr:uncharacterized protein HMPREF1120_00337 [Exophiala dermatitidis NIH/UT8656]KAJ4518231.1 TIM23 complex component [Exophiala dermatitidis]EHY52120.1 hypothetical protein HMPREF1120_00337 [Exophiala dermatitidis NIH/UT8656]KAJ4521129.1 TIM23 complex component [Exophiala dermatitidis]KAJ4547717.1 TIM23 complex component [Exophiala dermatitidis]KAJ4553654.1 TIM23 complex component [Exophiala dermatitidis]
MSSKTARLGLQLIQTRPLLNASNNVLPKSRCSLSTAALIPQTRYRLPSSARQAVVAHSSSSAITPSSSFAPSLCRTRNASTTASPSSSSSTPSPNALDWNTFFRLRTSRRRYALASSIITSAASTAAAVITFSEVPDIADNITKIVPTDPFISMGLATFGATFLGWLIGPAFGNGIWRLLHRSHLPEFTVKEKAFFERIKKHRVNPSGASTNNPVPDFYGEKVNSVAGYRRWLKDQRAFNRKRGGNYPSTV